MVEVSDFTAVEFATSINCESNRTLSPTFHIFSVSCGSARLTNGMFEFDIGYQDENPQRFVSSYPSIPCNAKAYLLFLISLHP
eukprot:m.84968 g.84968  ORF g.84968 m.84968 type:complete len:83 (+) comp8723_c0_seq3:1077-1325(+)